MSFFPSSVRRVALLVVGLGVALGVLFFSVVMLGKVLPYLSFERAIHFLGTKPDAVLNRHDFTVAFYVHITSSLVVLAVGVWQFFPTLLRRRPRVHRWLGKIYVLGILVLAAPSGLVLAVYANGGLPAKVGFVLQCLVWWGVTLAAWYEIRRRRFQRHSEQMIRSFAVTLAAMSLRTESYLMFYWLGTKPIETYVTVTWLSWVGNLLLAELLVYAGWGKMLVTTSHRNTLLK